MRLEGGKQKEVNNTAQPPKEQKEPKEDTGIVYGLNAVTKALEKKKLSLVVVCMSVSPQSIIQHIPFHCHQQNVPLVPLQERSDVLGHLFGMKTLIAVGIKVRHLSLTKCTDFWETGYLTEVVEKISEQVPPLSIPWLENPTQALPLRYKVITVTKQ